MNLFMTLILTAIAIQSSWGFALTRTPGIGLRLHVRQASNRIRMIHQRTGGRHDAMVVSTQKTWT